jgi:ribosome-associated toxin RatA of RatAB toxin-antitoxin module
MVVTARSLKPWVRAAKCSLWLGCAILLAVPTRAAHFTLTADERAAVERGEVVLRTAASDPSQSRAVVRAAVRIAAPPATVFRVMTDCAEALTFVPHLKRCAVLETAPDWSWQLIAQRLDYGWYAPALDYVIRADYTPDRSVAMRQVRGDFVVNEGRWELEPLSDGVHTLLTYEIHAVPPSYVPTWLQRRSVVRELPAMLRALRNRAEQSADLQSARPRGKMPPLVQAPLAHRLRSPT